MPIYQITSILRAGSAQGEITELLQKLSQIVIERNGVLAGMNSWGLQQLAYRMHAHQEYHTHGRYVQFKVIASPATLKELERNMKLDRRVIRHMTIKERNTSMMTFAHMDPTKLAAEAHRISKELLEKNDPLTSPFGREGRPSGPRSFGGGKFGTEDLTDDFQDIPSKLEHGADIRRPM